VTARRFALVVAERLLVEQLARVEAELVRARRAVDRLVEASR